MVSMRDQENCAGQMESIFSQSSGRLLLSMIISQSQTNDRTQNNSKGASKKIQLKDAEIITTQVGELAEVLARQAKCLAVFCVQILLRPTLLFMLRRSIN